MTLPTPPDWVIRPDGLRLAVRHQPGRADRPTIAFLPGYASDMLGSKALALADWAARTGHGLLRFDYSGCGESTGQFADGTLALWRDDARLVMDKFAPGPLVLIGSSMGGWLGLLLARDLGARVAAFIGIAAAPDFTQWGFSDAEKMALQTEGRLLRPSDYGPEPMLTTGNFWASGQALRLLDGSIDIHCPVRLLQGQNDPDVPWQTALRVADAVRSSDVQVHLVKDGDHRLSRPADLRLLERVLDDIMETL
jgi:pimeloyl-ACP methyl ester carboxylesterase